MTVVLRQFGEGWMAQLIYNNRVMMMEYSDTIVAAVWQYQSKNSRLALVMAS